jgi:hypothetical protein
MVAALLFASPAKAIVNGVTTPAADYPFMVSVNDVSNSDPSLHSHLCGGALISPSFVLTAAHCFGKWPDDVNKPVSQAVLDHGGINAGYDAPLDHPSWSMSSVTMNPDVDVALVRLKHPVSQPSIKIGYAPPTVGSTVRMLGYAGASACTGSESPDGGPCRPTRLQYGDVTVRNSAYCLENPSKPFNSRTNKTVCNYDRTMPLQGKGSAPAYAVRGDSGGPVIQRASDGTWQLVGVIDLAYGGDARTLAARTSILLGWLNQKMSTAHNITVPPGAGARIDVLSAGTKESQLAATLYSPSNLTLASWTLASPKVGNSITIPPTRSGILDLSMFIPAANRLMSTYIFPARDPQHFKFEQETVNQWSVSFEEGSDWTFQEPTLRICVGSACESTPQPTPPTITTTTLPSATVGTPYDMALAATGGTSPYTWHLVTGAVPGMTLSTDGSLSGTPTVAGTYPITVQVTDAAGVSATASLSLSVIGGPLAVIVPTSPIVLTLYCVGSAKATLSATGGTPPYQWTQVAGTLPSQITFSADGTLTLTAPIASGGSWTFTAQVTDAVGATATGDITVTTVNCF